MKIFKGKSFKSFSISLLVTLFLFTIFSSIALAGPRTKYYRDADVDTYGDPNDWVRDTSPPPGYVEDNTDCDDTDPDVNPGAEEVCGDGIDNNCDTQIDEGCSGGQTTYYRDADSDTYGDPNDSVVDTSPPAGYVEDDTDCDDTDPDINPGATEICGDGIDQDCNGVDPACSAGKGKKYYYRDADSDTYGDPNDVVVAKNPPEGYVNNNVDCDDTDPDTYPGAAEVADDGIDQNCNGYDLTTYYADTDSDTYGDANSSQQVDDAQPDGYVLDDTDCNDSDPDVNPAAIESCDGIDNNCDTQIDEGCPVNTYYRDLDGDTFGDINDTAQGTIPPPGYVIDSTDCDDNDPFTFPGAEEICSDGIDQDCDGSDLECPTTITFEQIYGYGDGDSGNEVEETSDGGYIMTGYTYDPVLGDSYMSLVKADPLGSVMWERSFGDTYSMSWGMSVEQTTDGGYVIFGIGTKDLMGPGMLLVKTDSLGIEEWSNVYGMPYEWGMSVQQTADGGYILLGEHLVKIDALGSVEWENFITSGIGRTIEQTTDGGYIIFGSTFENDDMSLIKTDSLGNEVWARTFGGPLTEMGEGGKQTTDGGYIIVGTAAFGAGIEDVFLVKTDSSGIEEWSMLYDEGFMETGYAVDQTLDGGYIVTGYAFTITDSVYLLKTDSGGTKEWSKTFGGLLMAYGNSVKQVSDGGYIVLGETIDGFSNYMYLIKTDENGNTLP
jgi:hypothetical protein